MKKIAILFIMACIAGLAYGAVTVTFTIPTSKVKYVAAMTEAVFDSEIRIEVEGSQRDPNVPPFMLFCRVKFEPDPNNPNETTVHKFQRLQTLIVAGLTKANQKKIKDAANKAAIDALIPVELDMPDDLFE